MAAVRGIIPAKVLQSIEEQAKQPICELFDLIAGTSTGGIIALGLTKPDPMKAEDLVELYMQHGQEIFKRGVFSSRGVRGLSDELYSSDGLYQFYAIRAD